ncbi:hypothetical protein L1987_16265 [Smallanthus sonchifolius]|uniref:Uncharacterized protein n=1 Tax=Smallanthus sonchifolius TaxID=185202 RepID=A0ACB9J7V5_9ASTR|nr:hypothetical protein L1987_16265 [Smallanthus sonchifolius]
MKKIDGFDFHYGGVVEDCGEAREAIEMEMRREPEVDTNGDIVMEEVVRACMRVRVCVCVEWFMGMCFVKNWGRGANGLRFSDHYDPDTPVKDYKEVAIGSRRNLMRNFRHRMGALIRRRASQNKYCSSTRCIGRFASAVQGGILSLSTLLNRRNIANISEFDRMLMAQKKNNCFLVVASQAKHTHVCVFMFSSKRKGGEGIKLKSMDCMCELEALACIIQGDQVVRKLTWRIKRDHLWQR